MDSVHVMEKVVVSGSRDRGISVWSIEQVDIIIIYHHLCTKIMPSKMEVASQHWTDWTDWTDWNTKS